MAEGVGSGSCCENLASTVLRAYCVPSAVLDVSTLLRNLVLTPQAAGVISLMLKKGK